MKSEPPVLLLEKSIATLRLSEGSNNTGELGTDTRFSLASKLDTKDEGLYPAIVLTDPYQIKIHFLRCVCPGAQHFKRRHPSIRETAPQAQATPTKHRVGNV